MTAPETFRRVWRVEHRETHQGPYNGPDRSPLWPMFDAHSDLYHPTPDFDPGIGFGAMLTHSDWIFGFGSPDSLYDWFRGWGHLLENCGYQVTVFDLPEEHVIIGQYQAIFDPWHARRVETLDCTACL